MQPLKRGLTTCLRHRWKLSRSVRVLVSDAELNTTLAVTRWTPKPRPFGLTLSVNFEPSPFGDVIFLTRLPSTKNVTVLMREPRTVAVNEARAHPLRPRTRAVPCTHSSGRAPPALSELRMR